MTTGQLIKKIQAMRAGGDVLDRALLKAGERVRAKAVLLCPVNTGELRNSIKVTRVAAGKITVGTNKEYAVFVEYGTGTLGDTGVQHTSKQEWRWQDEQGNWHVSHGTPAQPFLRPAIGRDEESRIRSLIAQELRKAIENA